nr:hypothetical protein [Pandoravirus massiliensis]
MFSARQQETIDEAARTGRVPFASDVIAAQEDAFDRAIVRQEMTQLVADMRAMPGHGLAPCDPSGLLSESAAIPPTVQIKVHWGRSAFLCASLLPDGSGWSVYRCDPDVAVKPHQVGLVGAPQCEYCQRESTDCRACRPYQGSTEPPAPTDPASADPWRWPIGVAWIWTHDQMEDHQLAFRRAAIHSHSYIFTRRRVYHADGGTKVSFYRHKEKDNESERYCLYSFTGLWASHTVRKLVGHDPYRNSTRRDDSIADATAPIDAHACVVGLAEAHMAADRLAFAVNAYAHDMDYGRDHSRDHGMRCAWSLLRGWIAAVEALLRNEPFYLAHVAPYEARLIEAASGGLISATDLSGESREPA